MNVFSTRATGFHRRAKRFGTELLYDKNVPLDDQTSWAKSFSQLVKLTGAQPLIKPVLMRIGAWIPQVILTRNSVHYSYPRF